MQERPILHTYNGKTQSLTDWAKEYNINRSTLCNRLRKGLTLEEALNFKYVPTGVNQYTNMRPSTKRRITLEGCKKCLWSCCKGEKDGPYCGYIDHPGHGRRPVPPYECATRQPGSVFEPKTKGNSAKLKLTNDGIFLMKRQDI